jgi:hypothetical protein
MSVWFIEIVSSCRALLSIFASVLFLRFLLPRNLIPYVHAELSEALLLLDRAEVTGAIALESEERIALARYEGVMFVHAGRHLADLDRPSFTNHFMTMRIECHRSPRLLQQLELAVWCGLTYKLYALSLRINAVKADIKVRCQWCIVLKYLMLVTDEGILAGCGPPTAFITYHRVKRHPNSLLMYQ